MNYDAKIDTAGGEESAPFDPLAAGDEEDRASGRRMWLIAAVVAVVIVGLWFVLHHKSTATLDSRAGGQVPVVTVITPGRTTIAGTISATGTLAARRELPVGSAGEGGQIARVLVEPGQWVGQGQVLATVDRSVQVEQEAQLAAAIRVAEADARLAQANLERAQKLVARGFISKADIDRLTATRDAANARVRVAQAQLGEMQARVRRLSIVAPAAGLVLERKVEPGQIVSSGSGVLFSLAKGGEMELLARLTEEDLAALSPGVAATVTPVGSGRSFTGQVWQISPVIDPQTRQGTARIALAYAPGLRPGGFANVEIAAGTIVAPVLPESAVLSDNKGSYVYIVERNGKVARRDIRTGQITSRGIVVTSGLDGGERVVQRAGAFLSAGETVRPRMAESPKG
ncbi:MAG: efflux RND transporter periplasmic adaptor subunit [Novosphingobium sp.]|jgi:RND family efflux transporter MFP subunit|nr:efflux RND transporter periplasmic adaptor subunit [Novosphingobium sp.]